MKRFNSTFQIEISANAIANKLLEALDPKVDLKKREQVVESIIGPMDSNGETNTLKHMYFALFGLDVEAPDFTGDDNLYCTKKLHKYVLNPDYDVADDATDMYLQEYVDIGECVLVGFDTYKETAKYQVQFRVTDRNGVVTDDIMWVSRDSLRIAIDEKPGSKKASVKA